MRTSYDSVKRGTLGRRERCSRAPANWRRLNQTQDGSGNEGRPRTNDWARDEREPCLDEPRCRLRDRRTARGEPVLVQLSDLRHERGVLRLPAQLLLGAMGVELLAREQRATEQAVLLQHLAHVAGLDL